MAGKAPVPVDRGGPDRRAHLDRAGAVRDPSGVVALQDRQTPTDEHLPVLATAGDVYWPGDPTVAVQSGLQVVVVPVQPTTPLASNAQASLPSLPMTYTTPLATAGEVLIAFVTVAVQSGLHRTGEPLQLTVPTASNARSRLFTVTYTTPSAIAGDVTTSAPVVADHSGAQVSGVPRQLVVPATLKAYSLLSVDPTNTRPSATAAIDVVITLPVAAVQSGEQKIGVQFHALGVERVQLLVARTEVRRAVRDRRRRPRRAPHAGGPDVGERRNVAPVDDRLEGLEPGVGGVARNCAQQPVHTISTTVTTAMRFAMPSTPCRSRSSMSASSGFR